MNAAPKIQGVVPPVPTVFDEQGRFDRDGMGQLIDTLIERGVHGLFFLGSAGEFSQLEAGTRREIAEFCIHYTAKRLPVWIGTGSNSTRLSRSLTAHAAEHGADGVIIVNPYYAKLGEEALYSHYASILEDSGVSVMLYNFPAMTDQDVSPALVKRLAGQYPALVGIKETVDSLSHIRSMITEVKSVRPDFAVMCGYDEYLLATLAAGGDGAIAASANFAPELLLGIYNSFRDGDFTSLMVYQHRIMAIPELYEMVLPFIPALKEAIRLSGIPISTKCLAPVADWGEEHIRKVQDILRRAGQIKP